MNERTIEIIVAKDGATQVQTKGFIGGSCREASKFIEDALGKRTNERTTPEFYQVEKEQNQLRESGR